MSHIWDVVRLWEWRDMAGKLEERNVKSQEYTERNVTVYENLLLWQAFQASK